MRVLAIAMGFLAIITAGMAAPTKPLPEEQIERGRTDFMENCAVCHGASGVGDGPLSNFLTVPVPNVTQLSTLNQGVFPAKKVRWIIDGRADVIAHGPRDMPVWGNEFRLEAGKGDLPALKPNDRDIENRIEDLVVYLMSVQAAP
ncbi:MAG: c-type cytochrome [Pseudomonadota bacterium]